MDEKKTRFDKSITTKNHYYRWLYDAIDGTEEYRLLLHKLHTKGFYWVLDRDENRAQDGISLRYEYAEDALLPEEEFKYIKYGPCTVLEMLVGLSRRIDLEIMPDFKNGYSAYKWFWLMVSNLDLDQYDNEHFNEYEIDKKLEFFMDRDYGTKGKGSLFPCTNGRNDMKKTEIWFQMQIFMLENYGF